ncbi:hypothetical protein IQ215_14170 [Cyanobacterium stanieri LEGE 03274]|uniref:Uncharacterized protein n=1 Tax=Cyanobacterium stanieri LEGE 03274 TaxID=1828756 RepID=A0ABR9V8G6_9CHRO|nr:hypothetical protein [Cyanobacterium stanieri]MBE9223839.1 hypothetical protein [Cyanobacterium stanieri LEGE 03274]
MLLLRYHLRAIVVKFLGIRCYDRGDRTETEFRGSKAKFLDKKYNSLE